jgi:hypothetical protein
MPLALHFNEINPYIVAAGVIQVESSLERLICGLQAIMLSFC